jgi:glycosyltransferase involved in cell wall biosynthesis
VDDTVSAKRTLRLAVYGPVSAHGGSTATAFFRLIEAWLRAGHAVDFFSPSTWIDPGPLVASPRFRYIPVDLAPRKRVRELTPARLPQMARKAVEFLLSELQFVLHEREIADAIVSEHRTRAYDALVVLNTMSRLPVDGALPVVSFPQGPPAGESDFVRREPQLVRDECGWVGYVLIRGAYAVRDPNVARTLSRSDMVVVSSKWSREMFRRAGVTSDRTAVLFPPVDLRAFVAASRPANPDDFRFLWLGRIVPRKRFRLALAGFEVLRRRRPGARLFVIGAPGYGDVIPRYRCPPVGDGVERVASVPHDQVPALLARTDVILQPSENENFGGAAAEGLACGIPTVLGTTNGTADALEDAAFHFDLYEPQAVATAMERAMDAVLADPVGISRRARAIAERNLDLEKAASRAAELIENAMVLWRTRLRSSPRPSASRRRM